MAAQITHTVLSEKVFGKFFSDKIKKDFFVGSCFPDIRYLNGTERDKTHFSNLSVADLKNNNSFLAGVKFHSIVDSVRENYMTKNNVYSLCPESKYTTRSLKMFEDWVCYPYIDNWQEYINYFDEILPDEINYGMEKKDLEKWHRLLQKYFFQRPNSQSVADRMLAIGVSKEIVDTINKDNEQMYNNKKLIKAIEDFYKNFEDLLTLPK